MFSRWRRGSLLPPSCCGAYLSGDRHAAARPVDREQVGGAVAGGAHNGARGGGGAPRPARLPLMLRAGRRIVRTDGRPELREQEGQSGVDREKTWFAPFTS
jgi:hypothetical protein